MDREEAQKASVAEQPNVADDVDDTRDTKNEHVEGDDDLRVEEDAGDNLDGPDGLAKDDETRDSNRGDIEDEGRADKRQTAEPLLLRLLEKFLDGMRPSPTGTDGRGRKR